LKTGERLQAPDCKNKYLLIKRRKRKPSWMERMEVTHNIKSGLTKENFS
jgi:hypothetical protein